jgi:hypothetical protein
MILKTIKITVHIFNNELTINEKVREKLLKYKKCIISNNKVERGASI